MGLGCDTTHDLKRCHLSARAVALIYNWWSWYFRLAHPKTHLEAITSRPLLLNGVACLTRHAGQSRLLLTLTHEAGDQIKTMISRIRKGFAFILANAPQLPKIERWPESGFALDIPCTHGYAPMGERCHGVKDWHARGRTHVIGALSGKALLTVGLFTANITADIFYARVT
jgi:hypothetical protein